VAVDIDCFAVLAVTREIRNVVLAIEFLDSPHDGVERAVHHQARNIPLGHSQLPVRRVRMTEVKRHVGSPQVVSLSARSQSTPALRSCVFARSIILWAVTRSKLSSTSRPYLLRKDVKQASPWSRRNTSV